MTGVKSRRGNRSLKGEESGTKSSTVPKIPGTRKRKEKIESVRMSSIKIFVKTVPETL